MKKRFKAIAPWNSVLLPVRIAAGAASQSPYDFSG
jgi:hypothetical protein